MNQNHLSTLAMIVTVALFTGCNSGNQMFRKPSSLTASAELPPSTAAAQNPGIAPRTPYVLSAQSMGQFINFSIYNMGTTDLHVKQSDFALIDPNSRQVIPYDRATTVIDITQPAIVRPNETLSGRAIFRKVSSPVGHRLVFKPDDVGTFADITVATGAPAQN